MFRKPFKSFVFQSDQVKYSNSTTWAKDKFKTYITNSTLLPFNCLAIQIKRDVLYWQTKTCNIDEKVKVYNRRASIHYLRTCLSVEKISAHNSLDLQKVKMKILVILIPMTLGFGYTPLETIKYRLQQCLTPLILYEVRFKLWKSKFIEL